MHLKHKIQNLIDSGKITDPEKSNPNTKTNPFSNYRNVPPPATMTINSGISVEEVLNSFEDINLQTKKEIPDPPRMMRKWKIYWVNLLVNLTTGCFTLNHLHTTFPLS